MKIAVITCYFDPDYVRARTIRAALKTIPGVQTVVVKNTKKGMARYFEIIPLLIALRHKEKPDVYVLTFRGQEILPLVLLLAGKKPVWFDEFIVPIAYAKGENHHKTFAIRVKHMLARMSETLYRRWLQKCKVIIADTQAHAELSARTSNVNMRKYLALPVGADEKLFKPAVQASAPSDTFQAFYYGNMLPLHGLDTVIETAIQMSDREDINFLLIGGKKNMQKKIQAAIAKGARITYREWVPFEEIPALLQKCSVFLAGPYGGSPQAQNVVTGKAYQALACAAPAIIGASPATSEYFVDKQNAIIVEQASPESLKKAIIWAKDHPAELRAIAESGRKLYEKQFSIAAIARRLQPLVDAVS